MHPWKARAPHLDLVSTPEMYLRGFHLVSPWNTRSLRAISWSFGFGWFNLPRMMTAWHQAHVPGEEGPAQSQRPKPRLSMLVVQILTIFCEHHVMEESSYHCRGSTQAKNSFRTALRENIPLNALRMTAGHRECSGHHGATSPLRVLVAHGLRTMRDTPCFTLSIMRPRRSSLLGIYHLRTLLAGLQPFHHAMYMVWRPADTLEARGVLHVSGGDRDAWRGASRNLIEASSMQVTELRLICSLPSTKLPSRAVISRAASAHFPSSLDIMALSFCRFLILTFALTPLVQSVADTGT